MAYTIADIILIFVMFIWTPWHLYNRSKKKN